MRELDIIRYLQLHGPSTSAAIANALCPHLDGRSANGGPTSGQRVVGGMLGKLRKKGIVISDIRDGDPRTHWRARRDPR